MKYVASTLAAIGLSLAVAAPVHAQNVSANNLVSVQLSDSLIENIANDLSVDVSQIPVTVQVPVGVAANVCDVSANVLAQQADDAEPCEAQSTTQALNQQIQKQIGG